MMDKLRIDGRKNKPSAQKYRWTAEGGRERGLHVAIVEKVLGKKLPSGTVIHHVDGNGQNNAHSNLVVCPSQEYHFLLHSRQRALEACGNPDYRHCPYCKMWDDVKNLLQYPRKTRPSFHYRHRECQNKDASEKRDARRLKD